MSIYIFYLIKKDLNIRYIEFKSQANYTLKRLIPQYINFVPILNYNQNQW